MVLLEWQLQYICCSVEKNRYSVCDHKIQFLNDWFFHNQVEKYWRVYSSSFPLLQRSLVVLISKSYQETVEGKISFICKIEICYNRALICMGQLLVIPLEMIRHDTWTWILWLRAGKGRELLPYKGRVYFYRPTNVFNSLNSWCLLCRRSVYQSWQRVLLEESAQISMIGTSRFQGHQKMLQRTGTELSGLPSWIQPHICARFAGDIVWRVQERRSLGMGGRLLLKHLDVVSRFERWVEVLLEGPSDQWVERKEASKLPLKRLRMCVSPLFV